MLPESRDEVDLAAVYGGERPGRPWVMANMVSSVDGSTTAAGRTRALSSDADRGLFHLLRSLADVILVGASTVRAERYGPARGDRPVPLAVVSRSLDLDWDSAFFTEARVRPVILTCNAADEDLRAKAAGVAEVVVAGEASVDVALAVAALGELGHDLVLCEGGPTLLGQIVAGLLLDELCLTVAPVAVVGQGPRITTGMELADPARLTLASALEEDGELFLRYLRTES